jgi:2-haloalkanoic acid dehalogenase type II
MFPESRLKMNGIYQSLSFDCYGTLVDWRGGLLAAVGACEALAGITWDAELFLNHRLAEEARLEAGPWRPYREIVARSVAAALARQGLDLPASQAAQVAESIGTWPPFADVRAALKVLGTGRHLAIVSNVDRIDIEATVSALGVSFREVVTAEDVRSYKPAPAHLEEMGKRLGTPRGHHLHVAQSLFHDIRPGEAMGLDTAWINRLGEPLPRDTRPTFHCKDLAALAVELGPGEPAQPMSSRA